MLSPVVKQEKFLNVVSKLHEKTWSIIYTEVQLQSVFGSKYRTKGGCDDRIKTTKTIKEIRRNNCFPESIVDRNS